MQKGGERERDDESVSSCVRHVRSRAIFPGLFYRMRSRLPAIAVLLCIVWLLITLTHYFEEPIAEEGDELYLIDYFNTELLLAEEGATLSVPEQWLAGTENPQDVEERAIRYFETAQDMDMLSEQGLTVLACLYWKQGDIDACRKIMGNLPSNELQLTCVVQSVLEEEVISAESLELLGYEIQFDNSLWVISLITEKAINYGQNRDELDFLILHLNQEKQSLLVNHTMLNITTWVIFFAGVFCCVALIRSFGYQDVFRVRAHSSKLDLGSVEARFPRLWGLSVGMIVFVLGDQLGTHLYMYLWATTPETLSESGWWLRLFLYDFIFRVTGFTLMAWMLFGRVGFVWRTFFRSVPKLSYWVLAGLSLAWGANLLIYMLPEEWFSVDPTAVLMPEEYGEMGLLFGLFSAVILAPIFEELVFRGLLLNTFKNWCGAYWAAVISSVIFSSVHYYDIQGLFGIFIFGLVMCWLYQKTHSLIPGILCHALYNLMITLWIWIMHQSDGGGW